MDGLILQPYLHGISCLETKVAKMDLMAYLAEESALLNYPWYRQFETFGQASWTRRKFGGDPLLSMNAFQKKTFEPVLFQLETGIAKHCLGAKIVVYACL